jgi:hypothetical protein
MPYKGDTLVGNDVWVGYDALVMPGVKIGDGAIVATRSVVTRDVQPYSVVGGNPAQVVLRRFPDEIVAESLAIRWRDWPVEQTTKHLDDPTRGSQQLTVFHAFHEQYQYLPLVITCGEKGSHGDRPSPWPPGACRRGA